SVTGRCCQHSLACTLYEMLPGRAPFVGPTPLVVLARHSVAPIPSLRGSREDVPAAVAGAVAKAMAKRSGDRFPSIRQFLDALDPRQGTAVMPVSSQRRSRQAAAILAGALLVVALWWVLVRRGSHPMLSGVTAIAVLPFLDLAGSP